MEIFKTVFNAIRLTVSYAVSVNKAITLTKIKDAQFAQLVAFNAVEQIYVRHAKMGIQFFRNRLKYKR